MQGSRARTVAHLRDERNCYQAKDARYSIDYEIADARMSAGYEQLGNFDSAGKDYEKGREQRRYGVAQRECDTRTPKNSKMLKPVRQARFRPQTRGYHRQDNDCRRQTPCQSPSRISQCRR